LGEWLELGSGGLSDDEVERAKMMECGYVDWAEGGSWLKEIRISCRSCVDYAGLTEMYGR